MNCFLLAFHKLNNKLIKCQFYLLTTSNIKINNEISIVHVTQVFWVNEYQRGFILPNIKLFFFKSNWIFASV